MKLLIISYYELKDSLLCASSALEKVGYDVIFYPLFQKAYDANDKIDNYTEDLDEYIETENPQIVLWWFVSIPSENLQKIKSNHGKRYFIWFNWDDPWVWYEKDLDIKNKCGCFDLVIASSTAKLDEYKKYGCKNAVCIYPGFDPKWHYPMKNISYEYDVSFCFTNLYNNEKYNDQFIQRKQLVDDLTKEHDISFAIFGPEYLKTLYPNHYKYQVSYAESFEVFNKSRINICTHVCYSHPNYMNERCILVLGSGGLLLVDKVNGLEEILKPNEECIFMEKDSYIYQIRHILNNYEKYLKVKENGYKKALKEFTWDHVADKIHIEICRDLFDPVYYKSTLSLSEEEMPENLWEYWVSKGRNECLFPFKIWSSSPYIQVRKSQNCNSVQKILSDVKMDFQGWTKINSIIGDIDKSETINEDKWGELEDIYEIYPNADINKILNCYFELSL